MHGPLQAGAVDLGQVEGGAPAAEVVGGQLAVDLVDGLIVEFVEESRVEIAGDRKTNRTVGDGQGIELSYRGEFHESAPSNEEPRPSTSFGSIGRDEVGYT